MRVLEGLQTHCTRVAVLQADRDVHRTPARLVAATVMAHYKDKKNDYQFILLKNRL